MEESRYKKITRSNAPLIEEVIKSQAKKIRSTKKTGSQILNIVYEDESLGYLNCIIEPNGLMTIIYLPFFNVDDSEIDLSKAHDMCNSANNILSPAKLVINEGKVFCATTIPVNISSFKKAEVVELISIIKTGTKKLVTDFAEKIKSLKKESKGD